MTLAFVDTNVLVYGLDPDEPEKRERAQALLDSDAFRFVVSTQVLIELHSACTRRLGETREAAAAYVRETAKLPVVDADRSLVLEAAALAGRFQLSIFDAMIVCAARRARCVTLFTEDLSDGQDYDGVHVENPFTR